MRAFDEAWDVAQRALELDSTFPISLWAAGLVHQHHGRNAEAIVAHERMVERADRNPFLLSLLASTYASAGRGEQARRLLAELEGGGAPAFLLGQVHWQLREETRAFALFERGVAERNPHVLFIPLTPGMERLRRDPRWQEMLERGGLGSVANAYG
jgi:tetratricopeptide (TPR) repeat protein